MRNIRAADNFTYNLVAGDDALVERREFAFDDVQVGAAHTAGFDAQEQLAGTRLGAGRFFEA
jgi:hypothetical protein